MFGARGSSARRDVSVDAVVAEWGTIVEVSEITGLEISHVDELARSGMLPSRRSGRALLVDLIEAKRFVEAIVDREFESESAG